MSEIHLPNAKSRQSALPGAFGDATKHGIERVILIGLIANTCIESTGRYAMELVITSRW